MSNLYECIVVSIAIICFCFVLIFLIYRVTKYNAQYKQKDTRKKDVNYPLWNIPNYPNLYERRK